MPLIYKNNKPNMKQINEMTQEEAQFVISAQPLYSFTTEQAKQMTQIVRDYYDPNQQGCATCGSGLRTAKDSIVKLYKENTLFIDNKANGIDLYPQHEYQYAILPISEKYNDYAKKVSELLNISDIRGLVDERNEKIGKKIRDNEVNKIPYMLVVGEKEAEEGTVAVREHGKGDIGTMTIEDFAKLVQTK